MYCILKCSPCISHFNLLIFYTVFDSPDYKLIGVDLAELDKFVHLLNGCSISSDLPTLLLSECSITYMDESM